MSETESDDTLADAEFDEESAPEPTAPEIPEPAPEPAQPAAPTRKRGIASIAWLALFLALILASRASVILRSRKCAARRRQIR